MIVYAYSCQERSAWTPVRLGVLRRRARRRCERQAQGKGRVGAPRARRDKVVVDGVDARRHAAGRRLRVAQARRDARLAAAR